MRVPVVGHTDVTDTATGLSVSGRGVCQDFAHLMLAALRARGMPGATSAASSPPARAHRRQPRLGAGQARGAWFGFDPANSRTQDERYIVIGMGRDYDDVLPSAARTGGWPRRTSTRSSASTAPRISRLAGAGQRLLSRVESLGIRVAQPDTAHPLAAA